VKTEKAQIERLIETWRRGFLAVDPAALASLWDADHRPLLYVAMERAEPIREWAGIECYFAELPMHLAAMERMQIDNLVVDVLGEAALVFFDFSARVKMRRGDVVTPAGRVSMVLARGAGGWRMIHYHESALAALTVGPAAPAPAADPRVGTE
jgi:ketosteroid isomerase-like protein